MSSKAFDQRMQKRGQWSGKALAANLESEKAGQISISDELVCLKRNFGSGEKHGLIEGVLLRERRLLVFFGFK